MSVSWLQIATLIAGSSLLAALVNHVVTLITSRRSARHTRQLAALRIAIALERYASDCDEMIINEQNYTLPDQRGKQYDNVPLPPEFSDAAWAALDMETINRAMEFPEEVFAMRRIVSEARKVSSNEDFSLTLRKFASIVGLKALRRARAIRNHNGISPQSDLGGMPTQVSLESKRQVYARH